MKFPQTTALFFAPTGEYAEAQIVELSDSLIRERILVDWWNDSGLRNPLISMPIDRSWVWHEDRIERDGNYLAGSRLAIVTDDGSVQGAMLISNEPIKSELNPELEMLFIDCCLLPRATGRRCGATNDLFSSAWVYSCCPPA